MESFELFVTRLAQAGFSAHEVAEEILADPEVARWARGNANRENVVVAQVHTFYPGLPSLLADSRRLTVEPRAPQAVVAIR